MRDHRVVVGVGVLLDLEVLLHDPPRVLEERPLGADRRAELLRRVVLVGRDRGDLRVAHGDLRIEGRELEVLLVLLRAVVAAREREDQRVVALDLAEPPRDAVLVGQLVVGEGGAGNDVGAHRLDQLLAAVDVVGRAGERGVAHQVHGERGDVLRPDDAPDRQRGAQLLAARVELVAEQRRRQRRVDEARARSRLTRIGAISSARFATSAGMRGGERRRSASGRRRGRRPPVPLMNSSEPPGRTLPMARRATRIGEHRGARRRAAAPPRSPSRRAARSTGRRP